MSKKDSPPNPFPWHADQDDVFMWDNPNGEDFPITIPAKSENSSSGHSFDKNNGNSFRMEGDGYILSLKPTDANPVTSWGGSNVKNGASDFTIQSGTLQYDGTGIQKSCQLSIEYATVNLYGGTLEILGQKVDVVFSADELINTDAKITVGPGSTFSVDSHSFVMHANTSNQPLTVNAESNGTMKVTVRQDVTVDHAAIAVQEQANLSIQPAAGSNHLSLICKNGTTVTVQDSATAVFQMAPVVVKDNGTGPCFTIGKGSGGKMEFQSSQGVNPFDLDLDYPAGIFNFLTDSKGDNENKLIIYGITNAFDFLKLLQKGVFAINGQQTTYSGDFNCTYNSQYTTVQRKYSRA